MDKMNIVSAIGRAKDFLSEQGTRLVSIPFEWATDANVVLETARDTFLAGSDAVVKNFVLEVTIRALDAIAQDLGHSIRICEGIFTNRINIKTRRFIIANKSDLIAFLSDLLEPTKLYAPVNSLDGSPSAGVDPIDRTRYNELDLTVSMNRHAVICELQRLVESLSVILRMGRDRVPLQNLNMETRVRSDFNEDGTPVNTTTFIAEHPDVSEDVKSEKWLFVNGICGEYFWLKLYCNKLSDMFKREISGIFNEGDGILWDLIECAGERNPATGQDTLIQRTRSSREAQQRLEVALADVLEKGADYIAMIAYSQGCLLLRLVLEDFVNDDVLKAKMKSRLRIFTFGNPSVDWNVYDRSFQQHRPLHEYVNHTEHFANEGDFVAKLGVLRAYQAEGTGYMDVVDLNTSNSYTFVNRNPDWIGHLFGSQYSLNGDNYTNDHNVQSKLLACAGGVPMRQ
jgi:hypothetical protein